MNDRKAIIYDDTCPMCKWYTGEFVKNGILKEKGRISFSDLHENLASNIDFEKGRHEIPLVDIDGGETLYGLDSMVFLLASRFPIIKRIMSIDMIYSFFKKIYNVVSYNRRVMAPSHKRASKYDCSPDFNLKYRLIYIGFALIMSLSIFTAFHLKFLNSDFSNLIYPMIFIGLLNGVFYFKGEQKWEYIGQVATVFLVGSLIVLPSFIIPMSFSILGFSTLGIMTWQLLRRLKLLAE